MSVWIGLDIGGTKCAAVCAHWNGNDLPEILCKRRFPTCDFPSPAQTLEMFCCMIDEMCGILGEEPSAIGISCGGPLDSRNGLILSPPNLPGWDHVPVTAYFREKYSVPVFLQNDANACAVAEWKYGAGRGCRNMIFLTFGTGLGAGLILNGQLYSGTTDLAGEVGHIRLTEDGPTGYGKSGSFEGYCSGGGLERMTASMLEKHLSSGGVTALSPDDLSPARVARLAVSGDVFCSNVFRRCGEKLGEGIAILLDILNPERVVIGSIFARAESLLRDGMESALSREALPGALHSCVIVPAALGEQIGDFAALGVLSAGLEEMHG